MRDRDTILLEGLYNEILSSISRTSEGEVKFYFEEVMGNAGSDLEFFKPETNYNNPKFDNIIFAFVYKGTSYVKVFSGPGEDASKSDSGSLTVSVFIFPNKETKNYIRKENNAFYNDQTKKVNYDPIIRNGKNLLTYVKSILDEDDRNRDYAGELPPNKPETKLTPVMA